MMTRTTLRVPSDKAGKTGKKDLVTITHSLTHAQSRRLVFYEATATHARLIGAAVCLPRITRSADDGASSAVTAAAYWPPRHGYRPPTVADYLAELAISLLASPSSSLTSASAAAAVAAADSSCISFRQLACTRR